MNGSSLQADVSRNIERLQIVSMPDSLDSFSFTLANALPGMRWTHTGDAQLFQPGNSVQIAMGYVDDMHDMMEGEITQGHSVVSRQRDAEGRHRRPFEDAPAARRKTRPAPSSRRRPCRSRNRSGRTRTSRSRPTTFAFQQDYVIQPNQSDLEFLKAMAKGLHCEVVGQRPDSDLPQGERGEPSALTLIWCGPQESFAPAPDTMPLKSFTPQMNALAPADHSAIPGLRYAVEESLCVRTPPETTNRA